VDEATDEFLTVAEVAAILKLNQQTVRNWIDAGTLPALHLGRRVRIRRSDFDQLLEHGYSRVRPEPEPIASIWEGDIPAPVARPNIAGTLAGLV
jgi:excisionase family DNA binding protein